MRGLSDRLFVGYGLIATLLVCCPNHARGEQYRFLFLAPTRPVVIEAGFDDAQAGIEQTRKKYADGVFQRLDLDHDGALNSEEAAAIPADGRLRVGGPLLGVDWEGVDKSPQDGKVDQAELYAHIDAAMGPRMSIVRFIKQQQTVRLYSDLDLNRDGSINRDELSIGLEKLRSFDFDDDETLSVAELQPFPRAIVQAQQMNGQTDEPLPLVLMDTPENLVEAARRVLALYGQTDASGSLLRDPAVLGVREAIFKRFDSDKDGAWNAEELAKYLKLIPGEVTLQVTLKRGRVGVQAKGGPFDPVRPELEMGGAKVKWSAKNRSYMQSDLVQLLKVFAIQSDADKNGYLDPMEFAGFQGRAQAEVSIEFAFEAVDLNGNQQVTAEEIGTFFSLDGLYGQGRLVATLTDEAKTLFDIIDDDTDFRLSSREFREGGGRLLAFDANGDGALTQGEINAEMMITFSQPEILNYRPRNANMQMTAQQANAPRALSGPLWFRRMDRNQDDDLSWGEFLGPREDFDRLDANQDGFITLDEAEQAGTRSRD